MTSRKYSGSCLALNWSMQIEYTNGIWVVKIASLDTPIIADSRTE